MTVEPWAVAAAGVGTVLLLGALYLLPVLIQRVADWATKKGGPTMTEDHIVGVVFVAAVVAIIAVFCVVILL